MRSCPPAAPPGVFERTFGNPLGTISEAFDRLVPSPSSRPPIFAAKMSSSMGNLRFRPMSVSEWLDGYGKSKHDARFVEHFDSLADLRGSAESACLTASQIAGEGIQAQFFVNC